MTGSDGPLYPPMSTLLAEAGIVPQVGFDPAHLTPHPDVVVVGNAVRRDNPEAVEAERLGLDRISMPEALARHFLAERAPLVVAGTHGKTTTSALAAWVWSDCGRDPGFLVGGVPVDLGVSFRLGSGARFLIEGDEYNAAYFDRGAKFLHYRPQSLILTSVEHDHADLYPTPRSLIEAYAKLIDLLPAEGTLVACGDTPEVRALARDARCPVILYGEGADNDLCLLGAPRAGARGITFRVRETDGNPTEISLGLWGIHNATNALAVWAAARRDGLEPAAIAHAMARFRGVKRRQELVGEAAGVAVIDDFAHHPTAVEKTLEALAERFPGRRLLTCFEPRSLTAGRSFFQEAYRRALARAAAVYFAPLYHRERLGDTERLDLEQLASDLTDDGVPTVATASIDALEASALGDARTGDVLVTMSSGAFADLPRRLLRGLAGRDANLS